MWRTLYAIGLALPRIVFRPLREFELIIPETGTPSITQETTMGLEMKCVSKRIREAFAAPEMPSVTEKELKIICEHLQGELHLIYDCLNVLLGELDSEAPHTVEERMMQKQILLRFFEKVRAIIIDLDQLNNEITYIEKMKERRAEK